jgi:hypothetical protein
MKMKLFFLIMVDFDVTDQLLIIYSALMKHLRKIEMQWRSVSAIYRLKGRYPLLAYCVEGDFPPPPHNTLRLVPL